MWDPMQTRLTMCALLVALFLLPIGTTYRDAAQNLTAVMVWGSLLLEYVRTGGM